jgi:hypothetical protein
MAEQFIHVSDNSRKAYLVEGLKMQRCIVLDANEKLVAGSAWLEEIVQNGKGEDVLVLRNPPVNAYRKDVSEEWRQGV